MPHQIPDFESIQAHVSPPKSDYLGTQKSEYLGTHKSEIIGTPPSGLFNLKNPKDMMSFEIMRRDEHKVDISALASRYGTDLKKGHTESIAVKLNLQ